MSQEIIYSFIIPHKNCPDLLQRCINSIPKREDVQIIVVDDNSEIDKRPNNLRSDVLLLTLDACHSKGAGHARNVGLAVAKGKWLLFADCDDYYNPNFINILDKYGFRDDIDVVYFNFNYVDATTTEPVFAKKILQDAISNYCGSREQINIVKYANFTPWSKMVKRSFSEKHRMYFEEVQNGNDVLYSLMVASCSKDYIVDPFPIYVYLKQKSSIVNKKHSFNSLKCKIIHISQVNYLLKNLGIRGTRKPVWYMFLFLLIKNDTQLTIKVLFSLLKNYKEFVEKRKEWVSVINERKII